MRCGNCTYTLFATACLHGAFVMFIYYLLSTIAVDITLQLFDLPSWHPKAFLLEFVLEFVVGITWLRNGVHILDAMIERLSVKTGART